MSTGYWTAGRAFPNRIGLKVDRLYGSGLSSLIKCNESKELLLIGLMIFYIAGICFTTE
jgi:hypothetical protein